MIPVDKGIPVPEPRRPGAPGKYPWREMEIGDSFLYPSHPRIARSAAGWATTKFARKFIIRAEGTGARVWRIA